MFANGVVGVVFFCIAFFVWKRKRDKEWTVELTVLSLGYLVSALLPLVVGMQTLADDLRDAPDWMLAGAMQRVLSSEHLGQAVVSVLRPEPPIVCRLYELDGDLAMLPKDTLGVAHRWLQMTATQKMVVWNPTNRHVIVPLEIEVSDLPWPPTTGTIALDSLTVQFEGADGTPNRVDEWIAWDRDRIARNHTKSGPRSHVVHLSDIVNLGPSEAATVRLKFRSWERRRDGAVTLRARYRALAMTMRLNWPNTNFQKEAHFNHPSRQKAMACIESSGDHRLEARIAAGILPYQGITITWTDTTATNAEWEE